MDIAIKGLGILSITLNVKNKMIIMNNIFIKKLKGEIV